MSENKEKVSVSEKVAGVVDARKTVLVSILVALIIAVVAFVVCSTVIESSNKKGLTVLDSISYNLTKDSASLSADELNARRATALEALSSYTNKGGVVGARANMLAGEVTYSQKKYDEAAKYWTMAASKSKKAYTAPLCSYNAGAAYEELNDLDNAEKSYAKAVENKDFLQRAHAMLSLGRVKEAKGDVDGAVKAYSDLVAAYPNDTFANLANTRLISLEAASK